MCAPALVTVLCVLLISSMAVTGERLQRDICVHQCQSRCSSWPKVDQFPCCDCRTLCKISCETSEKRSSDSNVLMTSSREVRWTPRQGCQGPCALPRRRRTPGVREAAIIARSVGLDLGPPAPQTNSRLSGENQPVIKVTRNLRLESLTAGGEGMVTARVGWDPEVVSWYLVSWETEGDGLTANLLTNTTSVNITLQAGTTYHLQVSSMSTGYNSECLEVDTHIDSSSPSSQPAYTPSTNQWLGATAAILVFLLASVSILVTRGRCRPYKDIQILHNCDHFKVYPPPITLRKDSPTPVTGPVTQLHQIV